MSEERYVTERLGVWPEDLGRQILRESGWDEEAADDLAKAMPINTLRANLEPDYVTDSHWRALT